MQHLARTLVVSLSALALSACAADQYVLQVAPSEVPYLGRTTAEDFDGVPTVTTTDGATHELKGPVNSVDIVMKRRSESVDAPFAAQLTSENLEVTTDKVRTYALADISHVMVKYTDEGRGSRGKPSKPLATRQIVGIGLAVGSVLPFALAGLVFSRDASCPSNGLIQADYCDFGNTALGASLIVIGGGMLLTGLILGVSKPSASKRKTMIQPRLGLSPTGGSLSFDF